MNYPNAKKPSLGKDKKISASRRGMSLEHDINLSNNTYINEDRAIIYKKPTPIKIVKVDYASRSTAKIVEAYYNEPSTTDYNGIYKGYYIDFEAKECNSSSFPFTSIHPHQISHLERCLRHGAIAFIILRMTNYDETYLIEASDFIKFYKTKKRKSLPYDWIKENGHLINYKYTKPCDYIEVIDKVYELWGVIWQIIMFNIKQKRKKEK